MQILKYTNNQYAAAHNQSVSFAPGINVILGNNETGKSTMITGIYDTLVAGSKLDLRRDRIFIEQRFPSDGGNRIDGTVCMEIAGKEVLIEKTWDKTNKKYETVLDNKYYDSEAEEKIKELLEYNKSIYNNIVFGRQNNEAAILDWFYSFIDGQNGNAEESVIEAREKISGAFSAAGGISEDLFLQKLDKRIDELSSRWNISLNAPEKNRGIKNPWMSGVGEILEAYYDLQKQKEKIDNAEYMISNIMQLEETLDKKKAQQKQLKKELQDLMESQKDVENKEIYSQRKKEHEASVINLEHIKQEWLELLNEIPVLNRLSEELEEKQKRKCKEELRARLDKISALGEQKDKLQAALAGMDDITEDTEECRNLSNKIKTIRGTLGSAKLHTNIKMLSANEGKITTADKEEIQIDGEYNEDVNGFVKILIPGIAEIMVSPQDVDITGLEKQITEKQGKLDNILEKYKITDISGLYKKEDEYWKNKRDFDKLENELLNLLNGETAKELEEKWQSISINNETDVRDGIEEEIQDVLSGKRVKTIEERIAVVQSIIDKYENEYNSISVLDGKISQTKNELSEIESRLDNMGSVTLSQKEFNREKERITFLLDGSNGKSGLEYEIEELVLERGSNIANAEGIDLDIMKQEEKNLQEIFEQKKSLYYQYSKIKEDFESIKEQQSDKFDVFYDLFNEYLGIVTGGQVQMDDGILKSSSNILKNQELLSRGTKQTILLAFRLALLKYYYQDESGILVLDDVLLDMDPERREQSVKLLQEFAKDNQIIFTTCDPQIAEMLGGNRIDFIKD